MDITVRRDDLRDLQFTGQLIAEVSSKAPERNDRWTELRLYRTTGGKLVAEQVGVTCWQGEHDYHQAWVCDDEHQVVEHLGCGWLAKRLYDEAGIEAVERID